MFSGIYQIKPNTLDSSCILLYKWTPLNSGGRLQYDRGFLLQLRHSKVSMNKPDCLLLFPELISDKPKKRMDKERGGSGYGFVPDFTPGFLRPSKRMGGKVLGSNDGGSRAPENRLYQFGGWGRGSGFLQDHLPSFGRGRGSTSSAHQELERKRAYAHARNQLSGHAPLPLGAQSRNQGYSSKEGGPGQPVDELSQAEMEMKTVSIIDEYLNTQAMEEAAWSLKKVKYPKRSHYFVYFAMNHVLERSKSSRQQIGHLLHYLIKMKVISVDTYLESLTELLQTVEDMEIDVPKIWQYLGDLIGPVIQDGCVPLSVMNSACDSLKESGKAGNLMAEILHDASQRIGQNNVTHLWQNHCMDWSFFVPRDKIKQFLKDKNLEFTVGPASTHSTASSKVSTEWINRNLTELLLVPKNNNETISDWIETNIPVEVTKENRFIRALMNSVCSNAIVGSGQSARVDQEEIKKWRALLLKYIHHQPVFELQALFAVQALIHSLEHPSGVLRTVFDTLFDEEIISEITFDEWKISKEEPEGKERALKQVVRFFAWLQEGEEDLDS